MGKCMPEGAHSFPAWAGQTNGKSTHSIDKAHKTNKSPGTVWGGRDLGALSPQPFPPPLNHNNRTNLWVWCWGQLCPFPRSHSLCRGCTCLFSPPVGLFSLSLPCSSFYFPFGTSVFVFRAQETIRVFILLRSPPLESKCLLRVAPLLSCSKALCVCFIQLRPNPNLSSAS